MFRRARLSVKPNVRPGVAARGSAAPNTQRGRGSSRPPEPATESAPKPAELTDVSAVDSKEAEPQGKAPGSGDEKTGDENNVEESNKSSSTISQRRKRISSTSSVVKPNVNVPSQSHPLCTINLDDPQPNPIPTKEKQPCSDRYRIYKAQKLREMLKEELRKEKKQWKSKYAVNETQRTPDRSKMTMRDFIYYLPNNNPMTSSIEQEKKTEKSLTPVQTRDRQESNSTVDVDDNEEVEEETDDEPLLVPRVKVAEDGSIILDEESLTVEVLRTKGPCVVEENDPIFERGSTTTYSSFRKNYYSKPWSNKETDMFFLAISMVGTDFSMIGQLFPHRARIEIKNKFKREEKTNGWRIDKAFQEKRPFDFDFFAHLLQKVLAEEEKRKQKPVKSQNLKEKSSSKPRKNVKGKKVTSEGANDDPDESVSTKIADTERPQEDAQIAEEGESLITTDQNSVQSTLEQDQNQKKKRRKKQDEASKQEVNNLLGNATVQPGPSEGEKQKSECQSLRSEANEGEHNKEQELSGTQNTDDVMGVGTSENVEKRTDLILSESNQQDTMPVAPEFSKSSSSDYISPEVGNAALCEVNNAESSCVEERNVDPKSKLLETDKAENVKPMLRSRFQRLKPNLSRAVVKKTVPLQGKTNAEGKSSDSETSVVQNHMEKEDTFDSSGMENTERENTEAETVSNLSETTGVQEDNQPKVFRPARLMRGRLQRPKPNIGKATERKEILTSQEKTGTNVEKNENESCADRDVSQQTEDQSCKNFQCEDIISQPEKTDNSFQNIQPDEPKAHDECLSIQEDNKADTLKQVPILRTRFQKPKPNIGRETRKREIPKEVPEEILVSAETTAALREIVAPNTSPNEKVPNAPTSIKQLELDLKETGRSNIATSEKMPEMADVTMEMETDLKAIGREISPRKTIPEIVDTTVDMETSLKATRRELIDNAEEIDTNLEESVREEISPQENSLKEIKPLSETETDLKEAEVELPTKEGTLEKVDSTEERETNLEETERREISALLKVPEEAKTIGEMETYLKEIDRETSQRENVLVEVSAKGERDIGLQETGKGDISLMETVSEKMTAIEENDADLKGIGREISLSWERESEEIGIIEERVADLEKTGIIDISPRENEPEEPSASSQTETNTMQSSSGDSSTRPSLDMKNISSEVVSVMHTCIEEEENLEKEVSSHLSHSNTPLNSGLCEAEDQGIQPPDVPEQFSDINLSKSPPQEQKPLEVKPAPFLRSRFKRPKPNLSRATLKRETMGEKHVPGKKLEADAMETIVIQQDSEQAHTLPQHNVASLMTSREKDKSDHKKDEAVVLICTQTEKDPALSNSYEPKDESQPAQTQENDLAVSMGTQKINILQQDKKESVNQTALPVRARLQRPRPNVQKARQRQTVGKGEAEGVIKEERTILQKDEAKKSLILSNSQIETEIDVVSARVSECRMDENQSQVIPAENVHVNKTNDLEEKIRHESKPYVSSPAQLTRRQFQKVKPNLGRAHRQKEEPGIKKGTTDQSKAQKPEDSLLQQGDSETQLLLKEKAEIVTSLEVSGTKDCVESKESGLAIKNAQLEEVGPSESVGEETVAVSSKVQEQYLSKLTSRPQLLKESNSSKIAPDRRTTVSSASEGETDHSGKRMHRKMKSNVNRGRGSKRIRGKTAKKEPRASKSVLVTLRASQEEDEDDAEDFESDYEEETCHLAPEELSKAPVFVPVGLRSPEPVTAQIEETMEELEITVNVADVGCVTIVEHQLPSIDVPTQEMEQEKKLNTSSFEMTTSEQTQDKSGPSDGSTEAAITLLTMGDVVLQSEISTAQGDVGICVLPGVHSKDKSHIPFSPDDVNPKIVHEYQELSSPVISMSPSSFEENKIILEEQSTKEADLMEEVKNTTSTRNVVSKATNNMGMKNRFVKPKPNLEVILETNNLDAEHEVPNFCVTEGEEVEIQRETEKNAPKATELEDKTLGPTAESKEQNQLACAYDMEGTSISQEANLITRNEHQEERFQEVEILSVAPVVSSETEPHTLPLGRGLGESFVEEPLRKDTKGDSVLTLHVPESTPTSVPEVQQENINPQDLTVNLFANMHQDGEDEQAFILTLVEIPASAAEGFTDATTQLMPNPLLPAPILVKSGNTEGRGDMSISLPVTSVVQDATCLSNSGREDSEKPPANLDLISRKRFHCGLDESDHVPPAKKCSLISGVDGQECTSEVSSKELNIIEETGESYQGQSIFPSSGSTHTTSEPQKEQLEPCTEKNMPQLPQDEMVVSEKERTDVASKSEQMDSRTPSSKTPLSRPGRRPMGFLSLICTKNSLESDEPTHGHSKKRLKPLIPVSRRNLKGSNPLNESQKKNQESSDPLASPSVAVNTQSENTSSSATQVSSDQPVLKEQCKSGQNQAPEEVVTTVSEYFFGDIFIEVDETE